MKKTKIDLIILGGSGIIGKDIIKKYLEDGLKILNLDLIDNKIISENYFYEKFNMANNPEKLLKNIIKKYDIPKIFIDCSYVGKKIIKRNSFQNLNKKDFDKILCDWLSSSLVICNFFMKLMKKRKLKGNIVLTSSVYGFKTQSIDIYKKTNIKESIPYQIIKSSIINFVKNSAAYYGKFGIRINCVSPGGVRHKNDKNFKNKVFVKNYQNKVPLGRFADASDISNAIFFLTSNDSKYVTGINLIVDGGFSLT